MFKTFKEKDFYYPFLIWIIIVSWYLVFVYNFFELAQHKFKDFFSTQAFYTLSRQPRQAKDIVIVSIDESSRRALNLKWPWPRSKTAQLLRNIASASPKTIGLDIIFSGKSRGAEDSALASALKSHPNIILGYKLGMGDKELPLENFITAAKGIGFVDKPLQRSRVFKGGREIDRVIRHTRAFYIDEEEDSLSMDIELVADYLGVGQEKIKLDPERGIYLGNRLFVPSEMGITPLNYLVHDKEFVSVAASLVLEKKVSPDVFKDKLVLIGATDPLIHDEHLTPLGTFSGVSILANSVTMMLSRRFIHNVSAAQTFLIIFILGFLILFLNKRLSFRFSSVCVFLLLFAGFIVSVYLRAKDIQFDYFSVFFLVFGAYVVSNVYKYSYLTHMKNRLKELAVTDPLTGFYNQRYFLLKLDEELKDKAKGLALLVLTISNYKRLSLDLNFEELKSLIKMVSEYTKSGITKRYKKADMVRISEEMIGVAVWDETKENAERFFKEIIQELEKTDFKVREEAPVSVSFNGMLLYKVKGRGCHAKEIVSKMESLLKSLKENPRRQFLSVELEERLMPGKREPLQEDILGFLTDDLKQRNRDLEKASKKLQESKQEKEEGYFEVIRSLIKALEEKDTFTQGHSERVAKYAREIVRQLGLSSEQGDLVYRAGLLHDIGKIGLPDSLLHKKSKLSQEERNLIKKHEEISVAILKPIKAFKPLLPLIMHHHEHCDGTGYPYGLSGDMIPQGAQILAVADSYDAITSGRGYKKAKTPAEAINELERCKQHYNPVYIEALRKFLKL
jgi:putative nucleotidyltransferase with HDIG domain